MSYVTNLFSKRLKQLRETAGLTQEQFAKELKVSRGAISYYEKGERTPDIEFLDSLYAYFNFTLPVEFLLGYTDNAKEEHKNMYDYYGLTDKACDELEFDTDLGQLISAILGHENFRGIRRTYKEVIKNYKTFNHRELGYISFLISDLLNKIIFDCLEILKNIQFKPEEREALRIKHEIDDEELDNKIKEREEREKIRKDIREAEDMELKSKDEEENAIRYTAIDKIHEKFYETIDNVEFQRRNP